MTTDRCEIFHVRRDGKLRWKWRYAAKEGAICLSKDEYELFYECLAAAREKGLTPTYPGLTLEQPVRPIRAGATRTGIRSAR